MATRNWPGSKDGVGVLTTKLDFDKAMAAVMLLADVEVLVGFPEDTTARQEDSGTTAKGKAGLGVASEITNAALGYIHDNGAPEQNIPARPFMAPGIKNAQDAITDKLGQLLGAVVKKGAGANLVARGMTQVGIIAKLSIQRKINEGIDPALAESTLKARARKGRKGAQRELDNRAKGLPESTQLAKPLVDTGQLRNAVNYAIRSRKKRKK